MKTSKNDITGDIIRTHVNTDEYEKNHEKVFGNPTVIECGNCGIKNKVFANQQKCRYCNTCITCD